METQRRTKVNKGFFVIDSYYQHRVVFSESPTLETWAACVKPNYNIFPLDFLKNLTVISQK